jgi:hypothetical protein
MGGGLAGPPPPPPPPIRWGRARPRSAARFAWGARREGREERVVVERRARLLFEGGSARKPGRRGWLTRGPCASRSGPPHPWAVASDSTEHAHSRSSQKDGKQLALSGSLECRAFPWATPRVLRTPTDFFNFSVSSPFSPF